MIDTEILEEIKKIIERQFDIPAESIEDDAAFEEDLNISELDLEDLVDTLRTKYQIAIAHDKVKTFRRLSDLVEYIYETSQEIQQ